MHVWVLENIKQEWIRESSVTQTVVWHSGHVARPEQEIDNGVTVGGMFGKRKRGRPITRWLDTLKP